MTIVTVVLVYLVVATLVTVWVCRTLATRNAYDRLWRDLDARRSGRRLTPAMRRSVRAAQSRLTVAR